MGQSGAKWCKVGQSGFTFAAHNGASYTSANCLTTGRILISVEPGHNIGSPLSRMLAVFRV